jgi:hypothetical protein
MNESSNPNENWSNKGQTLVEFAFTLPLLLLLIFGIIEFGRLFQSWVTIQNSARVAARYAVTGRFDETRYPTSLVLCATDKRSGTSPTTYLAPIYTPPTLSDADFQTQVTAGNTDSAFFASRYVKNAGRWHIRVPVWPNLADTEWVYGTWYGVPDCDPSNANTEQKIKDILRLPSIYDQARIGAAGLSLDTKLTDPVGAEQPRDVLIRFLYASYSNPHPSSETPAWFNVHICSARNKQNDTNVSDIYNNNDGDNSNTSSNRTRFDTVESTTDSGAIRNYTRFIAGACLNKERITPLGLGAGYLDQYDVPMMDAGDGGEVINIIITYNHPLITPLGLTNFVRIQSNRTAVNESFKISNAQELFGGSGPGGGQLPQPTAEVTNETTPPVVPTNTFTPSPTPTLTFTPTPPTFTCDELEISDPFFSGSDYSFTITNSNIEPASFVNANVTWDDAKMRANGTGALQYVLLNGSAIAWEGIDAVSPMRTDQASTYTTGGSSGIEYFSTGGFTISQDDGPTTIQMRFRGAGNLISYMSLSDFGGTSIRLQGPNGVACTVTVPMPSAPPTATPTPPNFTPSPTVTPNCASTSVTVPPNQPEFLPDGDIGYTMNYLRNVQGPVTGFSLIWPAGLFPTLRLKSVIIGGTSPNNLDGSGVEVWTSSNGQGYRPSDPLPLVTPGDPRGRVRTTNSTAGAGTWNAGPNGVAFTVQPNTANLRIFFNFTGVGVDLLSNRGALRSDFQFRLFVGCGAPGGNGGPGGNNGGEIIFDGGETPVPTGTLAPTQRPLPTNTPSITPTPAPPTRTPTPGPSNTPRPAPDTPRPTNTLPPTPTATEGSIG